MLAAGTVVMVVALRKRHMQEVERELASGAVPSPVPAG